MSILTRTPRTEALRAPRFDIPTRPQWETRAKRPLGDGLWPGVDRSMWLWRRVPMGSVTDARSVGDAVRVGEPLAAAYEELAALAGRGSHRMQSKKTYRDTHLLLINLPAKFRAVDGNPLRAMLDREWGDRDVTRRLLLFGVRLNPTTGSGGWRSAVDSVVLSLQVGGGVPLSDYDRDRERVGSALARHGFTVPTPQELHLADSWWNFGGPAAVPVVTHGEHLHFFRTMHAAHAAERSAGGLDDCDGWPDSRDEYAVSFAAVEDFDLQYTPVQDAFTRWAPVLLDEDARVVSVRALVEPARVTRNELRAQYRKARNNLEELSAAGKMDRAELDKREAELGSVEAAYAQGGPASLTDCSVVVGFSGADLDMQTLSPAGLTLAPMLNRQAAAWHETMVCSPVRANPLLQDLPDTTIAYAGLPGLSQAGDDPRSSVLVGIGEGDRQPVYLSPTAAANNDGGVIMGVYGSTGAGKTLLLMLLAWQFQRMGKPQLFVNPKADQSLRGFAEHPQVGGRTVFLDDLTSADGPLDPLRTLEGQNDAVPMAASMIVNVNPYGDEVARYATEVAYAIDWGVKHGARATGQALTMAREAGVVAADVTDPVFRFAQVFPMFRATFGMDPDAAAWSLGDGLTLVEVGDSSFALPQPGFTGEVSHITDPLVRTSMNAIRMIIWGGMAALRHRDGVLQFDESWILEKSAPGDVDAIGRLGRSWGVLPVFATQRPSAQVAMGMKNYISRALIGHIPDREEARAALSLFDLQDNHHMLDRITAPRYLSDGGSLNWESLRALPDPSGHGVARGSVFYTVDLRRRAVPVAIDLNPWMLDVMSTRPEDVARRKRAARRPQTAGS